jgi:hypothetical protein
VFYGGRLGFGVEIGGSLDPLGRRTGSEPTKCDRSGTTYGTFGSLGVSAGPLQIPIVEFGAGVDEPSGTTYTPEPEVGGTASAGKGAKVLEFGGSIGVQVIGHTKW